MRGACSRLTLTLTIGTILERETVGKYALYLRISPYISVYLRMIGTILERHTVGKYALGKGAPVRDCRALTPVRNQVSVRDRVRDRGRDRDRVRVRVRVRSALCPPCATR